MKNLSKYELIDISGGGLGWKKLGELVGSYIEWCKSVVPKDAPKNQEEMVSAYGDNPLLWP